MTKNMSNTDRIIRVVIAVIIGALYATGTISGTLGLILAILAVVFVATSLISFCPLYTLFGLSTRSSKQQS